MNLTHDAVRRFCDKQQKNNNKRATATTKTATAAEAVTQTAVRSVRVIKGIFMFGFVALFVICLFVCFLISGPGLVHFKPHLFTFILSVDLVKLPKMETRFVKYGFIEVCTNKNVLPRKMYQRTKCAGSACSVVFFTEKKRFQRKKKYTIITESHTASQRKPKYGKRYTSFYECIFCLVYINRLRIFIQWNVFFSARQVILMRDDHAVNAIEPFIAIFP